MAHTSPIIIRAPAALAIIITHNFLTQLGRSCVMIERDDRKVYERQSKELAFRLTPTPLVGDQETILPKQHKNQNQISSTLSIRSYRPSSEEYQPSANKHLWQEGKFYRSRKNSDIVLVSSLLTRFRRPH